MAVAMLLAFFPGAGLMFADDPALSLRATAIGASASSLTLELFRWSTDAERAPLLTALSAPSPPPQAAPAAPAAAGRGRAGRGGRGAAPPPSPLARLTAATKAAPTVGFIWGDGPTGYSIKYAWRSTLPDAGERIVLVTDRRLGAHAGLGPPAADETADAEFTVIEMRLDARGAGEAKASLTTRVMVDAAAKTLGLDGYEAAPVLLRVTR